MSAFTHIIPYATDQNIADAYNSAVVAAPTEWVLLTDADVMFLTPDYGHLIHEVITSHPEPALFTCFTNRVGPTLQRTEHGIMQTDSLLELRRQALHYRQTHGTAVCRIPAPVSGFFLLFPKKTWKTVGGFKCRGMLGVDWRFSREVEAAGMPIYLLKGLFVAHFYRLDVGERSKEHLRTANTHGVHQHPNPSR